MRELTDAADKLLASWPANYRDMALQAVDAGKAFCPACAWSGMSNCGYFDECNFIMPRGMTADEAGRLALKGGEDGR